MKNDRLKKGVIVSLLSLALLGFFILGGYSSINAKAENPPTVGEIAVNGTGAVKAKPDLGIVNVGVETSHKESKTAQEQNTKLSNQVMESLKQLNIKEDDIKTASYNMYRDQQYNPQNGKHIDGDFKVIHNLEITVRDIKQVGTVIDTTTKNGANQINNIRFTISDTSKYYQEALKLAVKDAKVKANTIAGVLEVKVGKPSKVTENSIGQPMYERNMDFQYEAMKSMEADTTQIISGELEITAQVHVVYNY